MTNTVPILPAWVVLPMGVLALLALAGHLLVLSNANDMDPQRRRIRLVNTGLMMLSVPLMAYGFGIATPAQARAYVYVWVLVSALLLIIILLALLDMAHSWRLHRSQLRELRRQMAAARQRDINAALLGIGRGAGERPGDGGER